MKFSKTTTLALLLSAAIGAAGCKKAADLAKYKDQATSLVNEYGPKLKDLTGKIGGLRERLKAIPPSVPAVGELTKLLDNHQGVIDKLQGLASNLPGKIGEAVTSGKEEDVTKTLKGATDELATGVSTLSKGVAEAETKVAAAETEAKAAPPPAPAGGDGFSKKLDSGFEIKGATDGVEAQLIAFIVDPSKVVDKTTWFNFDRLQFKTAAADLEMDKSKDQLTNISEILKAFPKVKLKLGGYTDNKGDAAANKKLSGARAESVKKELVAMGVDVKRLEAEGYGAQFPVCEKNDTEECMAKNRRIAIRVLEK